MPNTLRRLFRREALGAGVLWAGWTYLLAPELADVPRAALIAIGWLAAATWAGTAVPYRRTAAQEREYYDAQRDLAESALARHDLAVDEMLAGIEQVIEDHIARYEGTAARTTMTHLRRTAVDIVRPISHEIVAELKRWIPAVPAQRTTRIDVLHAWSRITTADVLSLRTLPWITLTAFTVSPLAAAAAILTVPLMRLILRLVTSSNLAVLIVLPALTVIPAGFVDTNALVLMVGTAPVIALGRALTTHLVDDALTTTAQLRRDNTVLGWIVARLNLVDWFQRTEAARALHGPIQSVVGETMPRIEKTVSSNQPNFALIGELQRRIVHSLGSLVNPRAETANLEYELQEIAAAWEGVANIEYLSDSDTLMPLSTDPACAMAVVDIVTEVCATAIRDYGATQLVVTIAARPGSALLSVTDNGSELNLLEMDLGVRLADSCSLSWFRKRLDGRNVLNALLPYRPDMTG